MATVQKKVAAPASRKWRDMSPAERKEALKPQPLPAEQLAEIRAAAAASVERARIEARKLVEMKPGTKVRVLIRGWSQADNPAEVVSDNMDRQNRKITAKRLRGGIEEETVTVRFEYVSLWRE